MTTTGMSLLTAVLAALTVLMALKTYQKYKDQPGKTQAENEIGKAASIGYGCATVILLGNTLIAMGVAVGLIAIGR